ncbi:MAG: arylsulfatase [Candidatus Hydrogenedentes bacterium]|nr:arylsulfatase [Candidatus Hydrogenedentota bacterium]
MIISRRAFLGSGAGVLAAAAGIPSLSFGAPGAKRPNILFLMADQFRPDCIAATGNSAIRTPHLDRLAREGVHFSQAYSSTPTCTPARSALLTGLSPWRHGMLGYGRVGEKYPIEMPRVLAESGYYTTGIGKMHWHPQRNAHGFHKVILDESGRAESPEFRSDYRAWFASQAPNLDPDATGVGFNDYLAKEYALPEELHPTAWTGEIARRFLQTYERAEPFFLKVSFARPHSPYDPPKRFMDLYRDASLPPAIAGDWAAGFKPRSGPEDSIWHGDLGADIVHHSRAGYYGSVTFIDEQIGRILETLESRDLLEQTLIVFTSDHGDMLGDHHLWRKSYAYDASARIPLLMRCPESLSSIQRGRVLSQPVELRDILPTFMEAAEAGGAETLDGRSLLQLARGDSDGWRDVIDLEHDICYDPSNHWNALTDGRMKYIYHAQQGEEQLFDLEKDPHELTDLSGDSSHAATLRTWRTRLTEHLSERGEPFVRNGELVPRPERHLYSPNYPGCSCHPK